MEALLLFFDIGVLIAVFMWAIKHSATDGRTTGLFRFKDRLPAKSAPAPQGAVRSRVSR